MTVSVTAAAEPAWLADAAGGSLAGPLPLADGVQPMPIARLVTVIITTSPTPSAPSTELLETVLASFRAHAPPLLTCPVTIVFDTYDRVSPRARLKRGSVTPANAAHYDAYKENVRQLVRVFWGCVEDEAPETATTTTTTTDGLAEYGSPFIADNAVPFCLTQHTHRRRTDEGDNSTTMAFIEPASRLGFGLAVRTALRAATTPYVWVQQHDWALASDVPLAAMLDVMRTAEAALTRAGGRSGGGDGSDDAHNDPALVDPPPGSPLAPHRPLPVRYICLPSVRMLRYAAAGLAMDHPSLRALTRALTRTVPTASSASSSAIVTPAIGHGSGCRLPLTPLFLWHDKPHLALTAHYLRRIFPSRLAVGRGDFLEDHVGQRARDHMKRDPTAWRRFACWLYYPDDGRQLCLRHLQGRTWRGAAEEQTMRALHRARNLSAAAASDVNIGMALTAAPTQHTEVHDDVAYSNCDGPIPEIDGPL